MPKIFNTIDLAEKEAFAGQRSEGVADGVPIGTFKHAEKWVESQPIVLPNRKASCYIRGKFDSIINLDDGSFAIVDFKTCSRRDKHIPLYARQLHAYAHCLENPAPGKFGLKPVKRLGLLVWEPEDFVNSSDNHGVLRGRFVWREIPRDDASFLEFIDSVLEVLEKPEAPPPSVECEYCSFSPHLVA